MVQEIVIIGGGFGGARVAKRLASQGRGIHITLIDKSRYHTFNPNLYEVATAYLPEVFGHLSVEFLDLKFSSIYPLEEIFLNDLNVSVLEDEVFGIDFEKKILNLKSGGKHGYDILVVAAGSETNYFGIQSLYERALPLKNFFNALSIRNAVDEVFANTPKDHLIRIAIGGGGFSGCELAGELIGYAKKLAKIHGKPKDGFECVVIEASDTILGGTSKWAQDKAKKRLSKLGIKFKFKSPIKLVEEKDIVLSDGSKIGYDVLVWTAGVEASVLTKKISGAKLEKGFSLATDKFLRVLPYENIFSIGDSACCVSDITGKPVPMTAANALHEANFVAENIKRLLAKKTLLPYQARKGGFIIPLGGKYALLEFGALRVSGVIPWMIKHIVSLHYWTGLLGFRRAWGIWRRGLEILVKND